MTTRDRLTWKGGDREASVRLPVEDVDKRASAHPAIPDEGITHPAGYPDPEQPAAYENGDTSSWAEDPHPGPYENSAHPAIPDEGPFHPAAKRAAQELRIAVENKAAKCLRIANAMLGENASVKAVEKQALEMMDLPESYINSTLSRLAEDKKEEDAEEEAAETIQEDVEEKAKDEKEGKKASDRISAADDRLLRRLLAEEGMITAADDEEEKSDKEASDRLGAIENTLATILARLDGKSASDDEDEDDDDESLLASLLAEEMGGPDLEDPMDDTEALLTSMLEEEMVAGPDAEAEALLTSMLEEEVVEDDVMGCGTEMAMDEEPVAMGDMLDDGELDLSLDMSDDPMGLADESYMDEDYMDDDMSTLQSLYASAKKSDDDEDEDDEGEGSEDEGSEDEGSEDAEDEGDVEGSKKKGGKGSKKAAVSPRPKKASKGVKSVGSPRLDKTASSEVRELEGLWKSAPDVSDAF